MHHNLWENLLTACGVTIEDKLNGPRCEDTKKLIGGLQEIYGEKSLHML